MGLLYDYAKSGGGTLPAAAGEIRGADVPVPAAALETRECHQPTNPVSHHVVGHVVCGSIAHRCVLDYLIGGTCQQLRGYCALEGKR